MKQDDSQIPLPYRQDVLGKLFEFVNNGQSCLVISGANMGMTRFIDFMMRKDVQKYYLGDSFRPTLFIRVNMKLVSDSSDFGFYELMLHSLLLEASKNEISNTILQELTIRESQVIKEKDELLEQRYLGLAIQKICQSLEISVYFIFDDFDLTYKSLSKMALSTLRGFRDANRCRLSYILFFSNLPEQIRSSEDVEDFFELFSRSSISLGILNHSNNTLGKEINEDL